MTLRTILRILTQHHRCDHTRGYCYPKGGPMSVEERYMQLVRQRLDGLAAAIEAAADKAGPWIADQDTLEGRDYLAGYCAGLTAAYDMIEDMSR